MSSTQERISWKPDFFYLCFVFCPMPAYLGTSILIRGSLLECQPPLLSWHSDKSVPFWHHQNRYPTTDQSHDPTVRLQCDDCILQEPPPTPAYWRTWKRSGTKSGYVLWFLESFRSSQTHMDTVLWSTLRPRYPRKNNRADWFVRPDWTEYQYSPKRQIGRASCRERVYVLV